MIYITDNRPFSITFRTNKRVKWQYATYAGRYETAEEAIQQLKEGLLKRGIPLETVQYLLVNLDDDSETIAMLDV